MDRERYYREDGYQKGFEDAKKTGGKIRQEYIDNYLHTETKNLSTEHTREFIEGWYKGFNDGVMKTACKLATNDEFWEKHIFWENPQYKVR
jgi:hypothetical protein